jgi:hypothetical protein
MLHSSSFLLWHNLASINSSQPWLMSRYLPKTHRKTRLRGTSHHTLFNHFLRLFNPSCGCKIAPLCHLFSKVLLFSCFLHPLHHLIKSFNLINTLCSILTFIIVYLLVNFGFKTTFINIFLFFN